MKTYREHWSEKVANAVVGKRIKAVIYDHWDGWYKAGVHFELDDGSLIWITSDDEGNGPGAVNVLSRDRETFGPTIDLRFIDKPMEGASR